MMTADSQAILQLCSHLGLADGQPTPLTPAKFADLQRQLSISALQNPGALLGLTPAEIQTALDLPEAEGERLAALLDRAAILETELAKLEALGIWTMTRADEQYPARLLERLDNSAPPVLFGSGDTSLIGRKGVAIIGSRNVDADGQATASFLGEACAASGLVVYSGGARGVDGLAMTAALERQGQVVGILADSLERAIRAEDIRAAVERRDLTLVTPYSPKAGFSVGAAMGRNKLIYALADFAVVVASETGSGGTWAGATEALRHRWIPVFVCSGPNVPEGNKQLIQKGALPFPMPFPAQPDQLAEWLAEHAAGTNQGTLY